MNLIPRVAEKKDQKELTPCFWAANCIASRTHRTSTPSESRDFLIVWAGLSQSVLLLATGRMVTITEEHSRHQGERDWRGGRGCCVGRRNAKGWWQRGYQGLVLTRLCHRGFQDFILRAMGKQPRLFSTEVMCSNLYLRQITLIGKNSLQERQSMCVC